MQAVAQGWLVLQLTNSPFWLGFDGFMATVPGLLLTLAGGVFADLVDRRTLLIYTQIVAGLAALTLGILVATNVVHVWMILSLSFVTGCCLAIAGPSYMALVFDLVDREDLANAVALNSTQFQLARVLGPVFAGVGFKLFGLAGCFFANAVSFVAVVTGLRMVRFDHPQVEENVPARSMNDKAAFIRDLVEGFRYAGGRPRVSILLMISAVTSLFGAPYISMTPVFARDVFHLVRLCSLSDLLFAFDQRNCFAGFSFPARLWHCLLSSGQQYSATEVGEQRNARTGDEYVHVVFYWCDAHRQLDRGCRISSFRRSANAGGGGSNHCGVCRVRDFAQPEIARDLIARTLMAESRFELLLNQGGCAKLLRSDNETKTEAASVAEPRDRVLAHCGDLSRAERLDCQASQFRW